MGTFMITALLFGLFAAAFWGGLRLVPGQVGRKSFFFGVQAVTLVAWIVIADASTIGALSVAFGIDALAALVSGFLTGALSGAFARFLNRSPRFAWIALIPFALPIMALMSEHTGMGTNGTGDPV
ncbi:MAG: hypothetical protein NXH97_05890 [Rhodobacteraceae bacterium]|nr:hypothetical protein [Paracoccaceae bacterium]